MTIVSSDDKCDGVPRLDGTEVTVIDIYTSYARDGNEPAEVADEYGVGLARVHEAIAYYYDHSARMRDLRAQRERSDIEAALDEREGDDETEADIRDRYESSLNQLHRMFGHHREDEDDEGVETPPMDEFISENQDADEL